LKKSKLCPFSSCPSSYTQLKRSSAFPQQLLLLLLLRLTAALPLLKKRPSLTSFLLKSAIRKSRLSRLFVNSPALASAKQKRLLTALPRPSKKLCRKKKLKLRKLSLKKSAQKSNSNKFVSNAKHPVRLDRVFFVFLVFL